MLETAYIVAKVIVSVVFLLVSLFLLILCAKAHQIKKQFIALERKIKHDLHMAYNVGATALTLVLTFMFTGPGIKTPFLLSALSYTNLAKYKDLYSPLKALWNSSKDLGDKIKELVR